MANYPNLAKGTTPNEFRNQYFKPFNLEVYVLDGKKYEYTTSAIDFEKFRKLYGKSMQKLCPGCKKNPCECPSYSAGRPPSDGAGAAQVSFSPKPKEKKESFEGLGYFLKDNNLSVELPGRLTNREPRVQ